MDGITFNVREINYKLLFEIRRFSLHNFRDYSRLGMGFNIAYSYDNFTIPQLKKKLVRLNTLELRKLRSYELAHKRRRMYLFAITHELNDKAFEKSWISNE